MWNDIPNNIRNVESAALFKKQARNYFLGQQDNEDPLKHDLLEEQYDSMYIYLYLCFCYFFTMTDGVSCIKKIK